jgi:glycosyltransferase involved in cell wall biosynthesis
MDKPLKFCMVTTFYPPYHFGGDATYVYRLSNELARRGHHVDVIHCKDSYLILENGGPKGDFPNHPNVTVYPMKSRAGFLSPLLTQQTGMPILKNHILKKKLNNNGYDVIHYHNMSLMGITALAYGQAVKLYTTHEHWLVCPMHVLWKYNRKVCRERNCMPCQLLGKRPPQLWRYTGLLKEMLQNVDTFISPSRFTKFKHLELGLDIPIVHIPYFLPKPGQSQEVYTVERQTPSNRPYFLFVGRLEKIKGLHNLIPIFKKHTQYDLFIAGDGEYENMLKQKAKNIANIKFLGRLDHSILQNLYSNALALIVPSICYEVFGIIIIEAFSMKTPVIVNNLGAMPEVVEDSGGGFVYGNEEELQVAMQKLAQNRDLRNELGCKGYQAFLEYWSEASHIKNYLALINDIRNNHKCTKESWPIEDPARREKALAGSSL